MPKSYLNMSKNVKVSIILPNFNSEKYLIKTVKSVLNQTFKNWELIIVDDNSNLNTLKILKRLKRNKKIKIFYLKKIRVLDIVETMQLKNVNLSI